MKIDLCKIFGVEEGEEFKFEGYEYTYNIKNSLLYILNEDRYAHLEVNDLVNKEIIKLPKKKQFSQDTLNFFKCIDKRWEWIAKDENDLVCVFMKKPKKSQIRWEESKISEYELATFVKNDIFDQILWEDEEPIFIDDYVER